jgi:hypothetical protein
MVSQSTSTLSPATGLRVDPAQTANPTPVSEATPTIASLPPTAIAPPTATPTPGATSTPVATLTPWTFSGVRTYYDDSEDVFRVLGDLTNNSSATQEITRISGTFYDDSGRVIAADDDVTDHWPQDLVPPGGRVPFDLRVDRIQNSASFQLFVEAADVPTDVRQDADFVLSGLQQTGWADGYCVQGVLQNPGRRLQTALVIAVVLYDAQRQVVNYGALTQRPPANILGSSTLSFKICVAPPNQNVVDYAIHVWGR